MKYVTYLFIFLLISCQTKDNKENNQKIENLKKRINSQNEEIQQLMKKLSNCKMENHKDENIFGEIKISLNKKTDIYFNHNFLINSDSINLEDVNINETNIIKLNRDYLPPRIIEIKACNWQKDDNGYFYKKDIYLETSNRIIRNNENNFNRDKNVNKGVNNNVENIKENIVKDKFESIQKRISGGCFKSDVSRVLHNSKGYLERCINTSLRGKLELNWEISQDGKVNWVNIKKNSVGNKKIVNCFISIIKTGRYNSNANICNIRYEFNF